MPVIWGLMVALVLLGHLWATRAPRRAGETLAERERRDRPPTSARLAMAG